MSNIKKSEEYEKKYKITSFGDEGYYGSEQLDLDLKREKELENGDYQSFRNK